MGEIHQLSSFHRKVVELYQRLPGLLAVYLDAPSDARGRRGKRYTIVYEKMEQGAFEDQLNANASELRAEDPEFAWSYYTPKSLLHDKHARTAIWTNPSYLGFDRQVIRSQADEDLANEARAKPLGPEDPTPPAGVLRPNFGPPEVAVRDRVWELVKDVDRVVDVTCSPADVVARGEAAHVTIVVRMDMEIPVVEVLREIDTRVTELRKHMPEIVDAQCAPELNFPPSGAKLSDEGIDPWLDLKGEVMRLVEPYSMVVAAWFRAPDREGVWPTVYVFGEDAQELMAELHAVKVSPVGVSNPWGAVPKGAKCIFNPITRMIKAQAEGNIEEVERQKRIILGGRSGDGERRPIPKAGAEGRFMPCRWCGLSIPASVNPAYNERCPKCGAVQAATTLPTKSIEVPLLSIFINPDNSAYFEFVYAPPIPGRWDLSKAVRCTLPGAFFEEHPMGRSIFELARRAQEKKK